MIFSIPAVQSKVASIVTNKVNAKYGTSIHVDKVGLKWNGDLNLKDIYIEDHHEDTLIYARSLATSVLSAKKAIDGNLELGSIALDGAKFYLKFYAGEESDNISIFSKKFVPKIPNPNAPPFVMTASKITLEDAVFKYIDEDLDDQVVIDYRGLEGTLDDFKLVDDVIDAHIDHLAFKAKRGYGISSLDGDFHYDTNAINLNDFKLKTEFSALEGTIALDTSGDKMSDFIHKVVIEAAFAKADISTNDIRPFYSGFAKDKRFSLQGNVTGVLNNFSAEGLEVKGLNNSIINGDIQFTNLIEGDDFKIEGNYKEVQTTYFDLKSLLPNVLSTLPSSMAKLGTIELIGFATITNTVLDTEGVVTSALGNGYIDLLLTDYQNTDVATYTGNIDLENFNLGKFINDPRVGKTSMDLDVNGKGFIQEYLDTKLSGIVYNITYNDYTYRDINVFGDLKSPVFNGEIIMNDPNLKAKVDGLIDISKSINSYDFEADIAYANLVNLNFVTDSVSILKGNVIMDMKGTGIEDAFGKLSFYDAVYQNKNDTYYFKDFDITSVFDDKNVRTIAINSSDIIDGSVSGVFKFNEVVPLFRNALGSLYTNYQPEVLTENQFMDFDFTINNKIVEVFIPEIEFEPETIIKGSVVSDDSEFKLTFKSPRIEAFGNMAQAIEVKVDNKNPLFNTYIAADSVDAGFYAVSDFNLINVTLKDTLFMKSEFTGGTRNDDSYDLSLYHTINEDGNSVVGFKKSQVVFKDNRWYINKENNNRNRIVFDNNFKDIDIQTIVLSHKDERIDLKGVVRDSTYKDIKAQFTNVDLAKITPAIDSLDLQGRVNGKLDILQKEGAYYPNSTVAIDQFTINDYLLGQFDLTVQGNTSLSSYEIKSKLENQEGAPLVANGNIIVGDGSDATIDLDVALTNFDLAPFDPLGEGVITRIRGFVDGNATITGNYKNPDINGDLTVLDGGLKIPYLNTDYDFRGVSSVTLEKQKFIFNAIQLEDVKYETLGALNGTISHNAFSDWKLDLGISTDRLVVLDTEEDLESLYFGTAFIAGEAMIKGPIDNLVIDVFAETEEGTVFNVPIDDSESIGDSSYIHFLSPEEKEARINGVVSELTEIKGLSVNFDLDVDADALIEIVVDKENGSTLKGRGGGTLLIQLDTNGKFDMYGDFIAYEGTFNFKYKGLFQKEFKFRPDGNIRWEGDPAGALLDISAVYKAEANPSILLENPSVNRKIPVDVIINLEGELLKPDITFDIEFPAATSTVVSELEYRLSDKNARELNAISLVSQGVFLSNASISTAGAVNNLFETTSSFLSDLLFNDDDSIFDVNLDLVQADNTPNLQSAGRVGITLSTQISNRVLINGKVGVPTGGISESVIVGDVEIDFLLSENGALRAKVFNRQTDIQFIGETEGYTQGAGLSYAVDFNSFKELIRKIFKGKSEEAIETLKEQQQTTSEKIGPDGVTFKN
ncbi:translocation/assembly module TamB domain-containing protein [uncultured Dokdonia sp.]|uniref:translocation/assembly module TamB domain-containing protein n=1 Tax=uncultured Dokdonia sp. TaxID=575653 RepID=UPI00260DB123|nr:translocation/assembly module TamB domain-containing protein [uncultured Dokdonia sp.]